MSNERASEWLARNHYRFVEEPDWLIGRKPDFYCIGSKNFWCEVKTLDQPDKQRDLGDAHVKLRERTVGINEEFAFHATVALPIDDRAARASLSLAVREARREDADFAQQQIVVVVPEDPLFGSFVRFSLALEGGERVVISSVKSASGGYGWPITIEPEPYDQEVEISYSDAAAESVNLVDLASHDSNVLIALQLSRSTGGCDLLSVGSAEGAYRINTVNRIREAVSEANGQIKSAAAQKDLLGVVVIFQNFIPETDDDIVLSALYGDLTYAFERDDFQNGELQLGQNGVFGLEKNTSTSAVCFFQRNRAPLIVHNVYAKKRLATVHISGVHRIPTAASLETVTIGTPAWYLWPARLMSRAIYEVQAMLR